MVPVMCRPSCIVYRSSVTSLKKVMLEDPSMVRGFRSNSGVRCGLSAA